MVNDGMLDNPDDSDVRHAYMRPRTTSRQARQPNTDAQESPEDEGMGDVWAPGAAEPLDDETFLAVARDLAQSVLNWARRQLATHLTTALGFVLVFGLLLAACANLDKFQALTREGLPGLIPGISVQSPFGQRFGSHSGGGSSPPAATADTTHTATTLSGAGGSTTTVTPNASPNTVGSAATPTTPTKAPQPPSGQAQTALSGWVDVGNPNHDLFQGSVRIRGTYQGRVYDCGSFNVWIAGGTDTQVSCTLAWASPSSLPGGALNGFGNYPNQRDPGKSYELYWTNEVFTGNGK